MTGATRESAADGGRAHGMKITPAPSRIDHSDMLGILRAHETCRHFTPHQFAMAVKKG
jgi:hypothetical protein